MIDRATVERIKEAANIVEVVSEFVTLRKSGANYKGLCPFHNEKTPSFFVSPSRGTCHCFGCGKGGNAVTFIMEHEQMTYPEALRWLANKYHIEIAERELTDEERREQSERESMFIVNEWAKDYFQDVLKNQQEGQSIGLQYFRSRGIRDDIIAKFQLGYDLSDRHALAKTATKQGYKEEFLIKTGICYRNDRGELIDRYAGRVIFPWFGVSGKVIGFGGRVLDTRTKGVNQKYVNSPESEIYKKDHELYGLFQAKRAIAKEDCVYMVEGYTDVIAMHQCGIENVVANSGTALSIHQIQALRRFTSNIILLYDGDAAGIHAAMRGTDMLLAEGMQLRVLLFPDGDDPDSFARKHTATEFRQFIAENQTDFIQFKTDLLLKDEHDPAKRAEGINSIVSSIAVVQNPILRDTYLHDCAQRVGINQATLVNQMNRIIRENRSRNTAQTAVPEPQTVQPIPESKQPQALSATNKESKVEQLLAQMIVRHGGEVIHRQIEVEEGKLMDLTVAQTIHLSLSLDHLELQNPIYKKILDEAVALSEQGPFDAEQHFLHHQSVEISRVAATLSVDKYQMLVLRKQPKEENENEEVKRRKAEEYLTKLKNETQHLVLDFHQEALEIQLKELQKKIAANAQNPEMLKPLMEEFRQLHQLRQNVAKKLGSGIIS